MKEGTGVVYCGPKSRYLIIGEIYYIDVSTRNLTTSDGVDLITVRSTNGLVISVLRKYFKTIEEIRMETINNIINA